jgi:hypothetical protein
LRRSMLLGAALLALAACNAGGGNNTAPANSATNAAAANTIVPPPAPSGKLAQIFTTDILGANVAYLETITGPAFSTNGSDRLYKFGGCEVIVGASSDGKIDNIGIQGYSPQCSFPIAQYFAGGYPYPVPNNPTFGDIKRGFGGTYGADCLTSCGNAANPVVYLSYQGSHADNYNDLVAEVEVAADPVVTAYTDWGNKLIAKYGQDYVVNGQFNTGDNLDSVATADFAPIHPTTIRVGQNLPGPSSGNGGQ